MSNRNTLWANVFVDELSRAGLKAVCIAPGSRSTPLTLAFARHGGIKIYTHLDERSAGFFALGLALASDEPVALLCTSGTAAANFFPAIVEAHMSRVPLIVITADRPPELRHSGANQTIDQVKMYGDYALWSVDVGLPEANPPAIAIRNLRTLAARAYARANGIRKGVVHINMPFRKPLEPVDVEGDTVEVPSGAEVRDNSLGAVQFIMGKSGPLPFPRSQYGDDRLEQIAQIVSQYQRGLIICGPNSWRSGYVSTYAKERWPNDLAKWSDSGVWHNLESLAMYTSYPILADALSGIYLHQPGQHIDLYSIDVASDFLIAQLPESLRDPDVIIRFGTPPTSKELSQYLANSQPVHHISIKADGDWADDNHNVTMYWQLDEVSFVKEIVDRLDPGRKIDKINWEDAFQELAGEVWATIESLISNNDLFFDGAIVSDVMRNIPHDGTLFVGNSLPVRLLNDFGRAEFYKTTFVYANRGASGIDGNISTALGAGAARPDQPLVAIVGDITFYHDMNGLLAVQRNGVPVTIVLLNNNGGGIFHRLPIKNFEPEFTDLFVMPHGLEFEHAARMYGLEYVRVDDRESFRQAFSESVNNRLSRIIEVRTDAQHDLQRRQEIMDAVRARIKELDL